MRVGAHLEFIVFGRIRLLTCYKYLNCISIVQRVVAGIIWSDDFVILASPGDD